MSAQVYQSIGWEDTPATFLARVEGVAGDPITQAGLSGITYAVTDMAGDGSTQVTTGTVTVATAISDSLVTGDSRWTRDETGYNFVATLPAAAFPNGNRTYRVELKFTETSGNVFPLVFSHYAQKLFKQ